MKNFVRPLIMGVVAALIAPALGLPATAADVAADPVAVATRVFDSADPQAAWAALTESERLAFEAATRPDHAEFSETKSSRATLAAYTGCWAKAGQWTQYSMIGLALFSWWQTTRVCASQGVTTSVSVSSYGEQVLGVGWYTTGASTTDTFRTAADGRGLSRAHFALGSNGWNLQEATPCGQIRLAANGVNYSSSTSCILNN